MTDYSAAVSPAPGGSRITVRLVPRASGRQVVGLYGDAVKVRVTAAPVDGKANAAAISYLAQVLQIPVRRVALVQGHAARTKVFVVDDLTPAEVIRLLEQAEGSSAAKR